MNAFDPSIFSLQMQRRKALKDLLLVRLRFREKLLALNDEINQPAQKFGQVWYDILTL